MVRADQAAARVSPRKRPNSPKRPDTPKRPDAPERRDTPERPDTKERIKAAARSLFARHGIEGVTVREILAEAGERNGASLNYHFGKKEELVRRIAEDVFGLLDKAWAEDLAKLDARPTPPTIRDLVALIINPEFHLEAEGEQTGQRLIERLSRERQQLLSVIAAENNHSSHRTIMERIAALQPHIPKPVMAHRAIFLTHYLAVVLAAYEETRNADAAGRPRPAAAVRDLGNIIDTAVGIMSAPIVDGG